MIDPHKDVEASLDLNVHNPLSLEEDSPWNQYFQDGEIKQIITQDIVRTHPDQMFFRQQDIQNSMLDILFCYAKEEPDISYRQGMHELLAPILFILHAESRDDVQNDDSLSPALKVVMDPACIDADAFALFSELMEGMQHFFLSASLESDIIRARQQKNSNRHVRKPFESDEVYLPTSSIARKLDKIHDVLLKNADEQLYYRLRDLGIPPQTYGIRWIRLLFGREFHLPSMLQLWDALFVEGNSLGLMDYVFVTMLTLIRDTLLTDDYSTCMQLLMKYPPWFEVSDLVQRALHLRNPARYPDPVPHVREWTQINEDMHTPSPNQLHIQEDRSPPEVVKMSHKGVHKQHSDISYQLVNGTQLVIVLH
uniref:Rab-GAP TBC domain-containing protein n=1 Tax=Amphimedon queenslandica TaxID=400682 RepID=A0A1X7V6K5_AMPQE